MISSLLSLANSAITNYRPLARVGGAPPSASGASYLEEQEIREAENGSSLSEAKSAAPSDRFSESLASRLKETGLTGPEAGEKIAEITAQAREVVSRIRREDGPAEANRAKAQLLTSVTADNAGAILASVSSATAPPLPGDGDLPASSASGGAEGLKESASSPSAEEIAARAAEKLEGKGPAGPPPPAEEEEDTGEGDDEFLTGSESAASAVRAALDEFEAFAPQAAKAAAESRFFSLVNSAEAREAASRGPATTFGGFAGYAGEGSSGPRAYQAAYSNRAPIPGSLLSVRV
ncbi:MAG: hypothetical protein LBQ12_02915 [Deltaproteobacteria bacterium]|jgi:hypothetical protein|nr:hypothetical protein [Deltaproteobacteria bacterium]